MLPLRRAIARCLPACAGWAIPLFAQAAVGTQSTLQPAGSGAQQIATLFWWMAGGAALVWLAVIGIAVFATRVRRGRHDERLAGWLIIGGGAVVPTVVLAGLLVYSLPLMPALRAPGDGMLRIAVSGERWWWRVHYQPAGGETVELANEIRLPVGQRTEFLLSSPDVIHSFWIPSLGGKVDMIPGHLTTLVLEPTETGVFRGACAEYCGASHAYMNFSVVVMPEEQFADWLRQQAAPAQPPAGELAARGQAAFLSNGCGACHRIRGTAANGAFGPDLTHVGSRLNLGAGRLPNAPEDFVRWIHHTEVLKPDVRMPSFGMLPEDQIAAIAAYLEGLQ